MTKKKKRPTHSITYKSPIFFFVFVGGGGGQSKIPKL